MANHVDLQQLIAPIPSEKRLQPRQLAWGSRKHHSATVFEKILGPTERIAYRALHIFRSLERADLFERLRIIVNDLPPLVEFRAENDSPILYHAPSESVENAARRGGHPNLVVRVLRRIDGLRLRRLVSVEHGTHPFAKVATYALIRIRSRIDEPLPVLDHLDALFGAPLNTGVAADAIFFSENIDHLKPKYFFANLGFNALTNAMTDTVRHMTAIQSTTQLPAGSRRFQISMTYTCNRYMPNDIRPI